MQKIRKGQALDVIRRQHKIILLVDSWRGTKVVACAHAKEPLRRCPTSQSGAPLALSCSYHRKHSMSGKRTNRLQRPPMKRHHVAVAFKTSSKQLVGPSSLMGWSLWSPSMRTGQSPAYLRTQLHVIISKLTLQSTLRRGRMINP